jgi:hypothetical protein
MLSCQSSAGQLRAAEKEHKDSAVIIRGADVVGPADSRGCSEIADLDSHRHLPEHSSITRHRTKSYLKKNRCWQVAWPRPEAQGNSGAGIGQFNHIHPGLHGVKISGRLAVTGTRWSGHTGESQKARSISVSLRSSIEFAEHCLKMTRGRNKHETSFSQAIEAKLESRPCDMKDATCLSKLVLTFQLEFENKSCTGFECCILPLHSTTDA